MLTSYLLLGMFGEGESQGGPATPLAVPAERVVRLTKTSAFLTAAFSIEPTDTLNFELDCRQLLESGEWFASISLAILPTAAALGFTIPGTGPLGLAEIEPGRIQFWPTIADPEQAASAWSGQGTSCGFEVTAITDSEPARRWQRTVLIRVVQK